MIKPGVPGRLPELAALYRTLTRRPSDVLAYCDRAGTSNRPTDAINHRLSTCAAPLWASAT